ncbi:hypothetical protein EBT25_02180 [bacterium]|nr:hypothetical protein [bacterium]
MKYVEPGSELHRALKEFMSRAWGSSDPDRFPGPQPISIERRHFAELKSRPYMVCEKNDGVRNMLVCFEFQQKKMCILVNRAFEGRITTLTVPKNTVLDGELMPDDKFLVYDAVMLSGENVMMLPLTERLRKAQKMCSVILKTVGNPWVKVKPMYPLGEIQKVFDTLSPENDGLIFTPIEEPVRMGTHETLFKWKPREHITIDFLCDVDATVDGAPVMGLFIQGPTYITTLTGLTAGGDPTRFKGKIVECGYGECGWYIIKERPDKTHPNNRRTYERTLVNIRENIQQNEFLFT